MVTSWHNNTTYAWDDIVLTETGAETNVFSYNEGGLEITVTLDDAAETTEEFDAFGATVYRSDQVNPARRTFFEETDEETNEFASSIFGAQVVLVDGLSSNEPDIIQVMLFSSTSSESYSFIATEDGVNTKRFVSEDGLWFVDFPPAFIPTANVDEAIITVFGPATAESQELAVRETGPQTNVLVTCEYIESEDTDYPEVADTTFHYVELKRWPAICGDQRTIIGVSGDVFSSVAATFTPAARYETLHIMVIPEGYAKPGLDGYDDFETVVQDSDVERREATAKKALPAKPSEEELNETKEPFYLYMTNRPNPGTEEQKRDSFVKICLARKTGYKVTYPYKRLRTYGVDLVAQARPQNDAGGGPGPLIRGTQCVANTLHDYLGHNVVYDEFLTSTEFASFWAERIRKGTETPIVYVGCHSFLKLVNPYDPTGRLELEADWYRRVIAGASKGANTVSALRVRMFFVSSCRAASTLRNLAEWQGILDAYAAYGPTTRKNGRFDQFVMALYFKLHDCHSDRRAKHTFTQMIDPTIHGLVSHINCELEKEYATTGSCHYGDIRSYKSYLLNMNKPNRPLIDGVVPNQLDERRFLLDWHVRRKEDNK